MTKDLQSRRTFIKKGLAGSVALAAGFPAIASIPSDKGRDDVLDKVRSGKCTISTRGDLLVRIYSEKITTPVKLMLVSDTHLWMSDSREDPFRQYSGRMSKAYNQTRHFQTLEDTNPNEAFKKTLGIAKESGVDAIFHLGDLVSFPSEAGVEWAVEQFNATGIPWYYVSGNHDWHYEGMEGTEIALRNEWTARRLSPLYKGNNPLLYSVDVKGLKVIMLDDSVYEILPEQLDLFRKEMKEGKPSLMMSHIPLYAPGFSTGYGCGHPDWNATTDRNYEIERRPRWPVEGHSQTTFDFWKEVIRSQRKYNLLATFAGHVHTQSCSFVDGWHQFTLKANLTGAYLIVEVLPV
ncbi:MAG: metallophosphoesterase [Bacteroidales bacterium]|nr:metallophosphoesterase [Bacteroidales bacterium]